MLASALHSLWIPISTQNCSRQTQRTRKRWSRLWAGGPELCRLEGGAEAGKKALRQVRWPRRSDLAGFH